MFTNTTPCKITHASCLVMSNRTSGNTFRHPNVTALHCQKYTVGVYPEDIRELMRTGWKLTTRPFQSGKHGEHLMLKTFQNVVDHPSTKLDISCKDASLSSALCSVSCILHAWIRHLYAHCASLVFFVGRSTMRMKKQPNWQLAGQVVSLHICFWRFSFGFLKSFSTSQSLLQHLLPKASVPSHPPLLFLFM